LSRGSGWGSLGGRCGFFRGCFGFGFSLGNGLSDLIVNIFKDLFGKGILENILEDVFGSRGAFLFTTL
jgi:hypothetical protein